MDMRLPVALKLVVLGAAVASSLGVTHTDANPNANRLYEDLMMSYSRFVRPVQNDSDTLLVKLGLKLSQLIDVVSCLTQKEGNRDGIRRDCNTQNSTWQ